MVRSSDFLRALEQRDRDCNIDPPTSSYAIMRRARPYRGENSEPGKDDHGELDQIAVTIGDFVSTRPSVMGRMRSSPPNDRHVAELALLSVVSAEAATLCCQTER